MNVPALLIVAVLAHLSPHTVAQLSGGKAYAWETVMLGVESSALWLLALTVTERMRGAAAASCVVVSIYGLFESVQRAACRLAFPMDAPLRLPDGAFACDVATGFPFSILSLPLALMAAMLTLKAHRT